MIKNKIFPITEKLGVYFILRSKSFKDIDKYKYCFNIGIDILLNENKYDDKTIKEISEEFFNNKEFSQVFNLLSDAYFH